MGTFRDITGQKFNCLTPLNRVENRGRRTYWLCQCDCGKTTEVWQSNIVNGGVKSCGCLNAAENLLGRRFGRWTVIDSSSPRKGNVRWLCRCDCGAEKSISATELRAGRTRSCGCLSAELSGNRNRTHGLYGTPEYWRTQNERRLSKKKELDCLWTPEMSKLLKSMFPYCVVCKRRDRLEVDHVSPLSAGCGLRPGNAVILCKKCNNKKNAKRLVDLDVSWVVSILRAADAFYFECLKEGLWLND